MRQGRFVPSVARRACCWGPRRRLPGCWPSRPWPRRPPGCRWPGPNPSASRRTRSAKMDEGMQSLVDKQHLAGVVTLVARHGKVVQHKAYGVQDLDSRAPMELDTIARICSMTKPVTGVAMMMLYEEGKWQPSDPIAKHIPEFANLKVFAGADANGAPILEAPAHAPTMGELMSHTAGFTYGSLRQHARWTRCTRPPPHLALRRSRGSSTGWRRCRCSTSPARAGSTASASISRAISWRSCRARPSPSSCAPASSIRSG